MTGAEGGHANPDALLHDLAVVLLMAGIVTVLFHRLRQPVVLGYLVAGVIIGPHTPPAILIQDRASIDVLAQIGMVFLMFSLGLHFSLRKLWQVGAAAFVAAFLEIVVMLWIGYQTGRMFGWGQMDSIFLGAILSISSTTIIVKALSDLGLLHERFAQLAFGILVVEDILGIAIIALLSGLAATGTVAPGTAATELSKLAAFLAAVVVIGLLVVPRLMRSIGRLRSPETLLVATVGLCFLVSLVTIELGYSLALGAFLIGAIVGEARERAQIERLVAPVRDLFSAVFFVSIGMLIDPRILAEHWLAVLVITAAVVVGKIASNAVGAFLAGNHPRLALRTGMGLAQIGEFSFIIAHLGASSGVTSTFLYPIAVTVSAITTLLTPYLIKHSDAVIDVVERRAPRRFIIAGSVYHEWAKRWFAGSARGGTLGRFFRRLAVQIAVNVSLVTGLFIAASALAGRAAAWDQHLPAWTGGGRTVLWLAAMLLALPLLAHTWSKLRSLSMILAEMGLARVRDREQMVRARTVVAAVIVAVGAIAIAAWLLLLGLAILPPAPVLGALTVLLIVVGVLTFRSFLTLYGRAQVRLEQTLAEPHPDEPPPALTHMSVALSEAEIDRVPVPAAAPAAGKGIIALRLRSSTGATIVAIEREGGNVINPGPDERIAAGDVVVLLGKREDLDSARRLLLGG